MASGTYRPLAPRLVAIRTCRSPKAAAPSTFSGPARKAVYPFSHYRLARLFDLKIEEIFIDDH